MAQERNGREAKQLPELLVRDANGWRRWLMQAGGLAEIERAKSDGRWAAAYAGAATSVVPPDLARALNAKPAAKVKFAGLSAQNRYAILYRVAQAKRPETRASRIEKFTTMLARGETIYPQRPVATKSGR